MTDHEVQAVLGMQHSEKRQWKPYLLVVVRTTLSSYTFLVPCD
jgi:hypothetical protein